MIEFRLYDLGLFFPVPGLQLTFSVLRYFFVIYLLGVCLFDRVYDFFMNFSRMYVYYMVYDL